MSTDLNIVTNNKCNVNALSDSRVVVCWRTRTTKSLGAFLQVLSPNTTKILQFKHVWSSNTKHTQLTAKRTLSEFNWIYFYYTFNVNYEHFQ